MWGQLQAGLFLSLSLNLFSFLTMYSIKYISCDDATYVAIDNLRAYVQGPQIQSILNGTRPYTFPFKKEQNDDKWNFQTHPERPLVLGQPGTDRRGRVSAAFESGYTLNRAALRLFEEIIPNCDKVNSTDVNVDATSYCLATSKYRVSVVDTRDEQGSYRYHEKPLQFIGELKLRPSGIEKKYFPAKYGPPGVSKQSISFDLENAVKTRHGYQKDTRENTINRMYRYHAILMGLCSYENPFPSPPPKISTDPSRITITKSKIELYDIGCHEQMGKGSEGEEGFKVLDKVRKGVIKSKNEGDKNETRILCMVYTHSERKDFMEAITNTWGTQCDGFFFASNVTDSRMGSIDIPHLGRESYDNMWQKIRSTWDYAFRNFLDSFDYFHICGDDAYLVVDNLRAYVNSPEIAALLSGEKKVAWHETMEGEEGWDFEKFPDRPLLLSQASHTRSGSYNTFPGGGSGYTLNRAALKMLGEDVLPTCRVGLQNSEEDLNIGYCFMNMPKMLYGMSSSIVTADTRDSTGAFRYHMQSAQFQGNLGFGASAPWSPQLLEEFFQFQTLSGVDGASEQSIAFHLRGEKSKRNEVFVPDPEQILNRMYRYHAILNSACLEK